MKPTKERILDAAENLFARRGFEATSVAEIADRVGVRGPAVYKHFANKRALFEAVLERLFTPFTAMVEGLDADQSPQSVSAAIIAHHAKHPNISRIIQQATLAGDEQLKILAQRWYIPFFSHVRARLRVEGTDTPTVVMAFHSMLLGYVTLAPLHKAIFGENPLDKAHIEQWVTLQSLLSQRVFES